MAYKPHALLRFGGPFFVTEQWSCGLRLITDDDTATVGQWISALQPNEPGAIPTLLDDMLPAIRNWFGAPDSKHSNQARLAYVELNAIGPNGLYADGGNPHRAEFETADTVPGFNTTPTWPQLTTVLSLRTAVTRGRATRGRIYAPTACTAAASGRIDPSETQAMATSFASLLEELDSQESLALAGEPRVAVVSAGDGPMAPGVGPARIVTRVEVGDVLDTQRRRRNQLVEVYTAADVSS